MRRVIYKCRRLTDLFCNGSITLDQYYAERNKIISAWAIDVVAALVAKNIEWDRA